MNNPSESNTPATNDAPTPKKPFNHPNLLITATMKEGQTFEDFKNNIIQAMKDKGILKPNGSSKLVAQSQQEPDSKPEDEFNRKPKGWSAEKERKRIESGELRSLFSADETFTKPKNQ